ncbi:MAG: sensor histidine kinase, partial [Spirochaetales bacterium]
TVTAAPYESGGKRHTLLTVQDASHEKRRRALERVFFHDLANIASGLAGLADAIQRAREINEQRKMLGMMDKSARSLIDEIEAQRQLLSAETGDLAPNPQRTNSLELMRGVCEALRYHLVADGRSIVVEKHADDVTWLTDPILLRRVLVNLAKNGLEAIPPGGVVTLGSHDDGDTIVLTVHNDGEIAPEARYQLFQRSFSTKGAGRGLGSYSVRLLTERYLGGTVSFTSSDEHGTLFRIALPVVIR